MGTLTDNIPPELAELPRWVGAHADSKCPMKVFDKSRASVSRPGSWGTFEQACRCIERGVYEYAGFVFADDGLVGIDIDCAFDEDGFLTEDAYEVMCACHSYTEVSKSGRGLHIICRGDIPFKGRNNQAGWEIYKDARYFVLTGRTINYPTICDAQDGINLVLEKHFVVTTKMSISSESGPKIFVPTWRKPTPTHVWIEPDYPVVTSGSRHLSMVSYCGQYHSAGASPDVLFRMACVANRRYMSPPLPEDEIEQIVRSVMRYKR